MYDILFLLINYFYDIVQEGVMNVTVIATNVFEVFTYDLTFEMVGKVRGPIIDDFQIISNKEQSKEFEISFDALGSATCLVLDFKDGIVKVQKSVKVKILISLKFPDIWRCRIL